MVEKTACLKRVNRDNSIHTGQGKAKAKEYVNKTMNVKAGSQPLPDIVSNMKAGSSKRANREFVDKAPESKKRKKQEVYKSRVDRGKRSVCNKRKTLPNIQTAPPNENSAEYQVVTSFVHKNASSDCQSLIQVNIEVEARSLPNLVVHENIDIKLTLSSSHNLLVNYEQECQHDNQSTDVSVVPESSDGLADALRTFRRQSKWSCSIL